MLVKDPEELRAKFQKELTNGLLVASLTLAEEGTPKYDHYVEWGTIMSHFQPFLSYIRTLIQPCKGIVLIDIVSTDGAMVVGALLTAEKEPLTIGTTKVEMDITSALSMGDSAQALVELTLNYLVDGSIDPNFSPTQYYTCPYFTGTSALAGLGGTSTPKPKELVKDRVATLLEDAAQLDLEQLESALAILKGEQMKRRHEGIHDDGKGKTGKGANPTGAVKPTTEGKLKFQFGPTNLEDGETNPTVGEGHPKPAPDPGSPLVPLRKTHLNPHDPLGFNIFPGGPGEAAADHQSNLDMASKFTALHEKTILTTSEYLVKTLKQEGAFKTETPRLDTFTGDDDSKGISFEHWQYQVQMLEKSHAPHAIREAMVRSLKGTAAEVVRALEADASWQQMLDALRVKFEVVGSLASLTTKLFTMKMSEKQTVSAYATQVESALAQLKHRFPQNYTGEVSQRTLRDKFFDGLPEPYKATLRYKYDNPAVSYSSLLQTAREIEVEHKANESKGSTTVKQEQGKKVKAHAAAAMATDSGSASSDLHKLEQKFGSTQGELQKLQKQMGELTTAMSQLLTLGHPSTQAPSANASWNPRGRGRGRGGQGRGRGFNPQNPQQQQAQAFGSSTVPGKPPGWERLCYWCRDFMPLHQANHPIRLCPWYQQGRKDWWNKQQQGQQQQATSQPNTNSTSQSTFQGNN